MSQRHATSLQASKHNPTDSPSDKNYQALALRLQHILYTHGYRIAASKFPYNDWNIQHALRQWEDWYEPKEPVYFSIRRHWPRDSEDEAKQKLTRKV